MKDVADDEEEEVAGEESHTGEDEAEGDTPMGLLCAPRMVHSLSRRRH